MTDFFRCSRRAFFPALAAAGGCLAQLLRDASCTRGEESPNKNFSASDIDAAVERARKFLLASQSTDGAWRSGTYGQLKDGTALTPLVFRVCRNERAQDYLAQLSEKLEAMETSYTTYIAANALIALGTTQLADQRDQRNRFLKILRAHQHSAALGWESTDLEFGGWGYSLTPPRKGDSSEQPSPLAQPNLSATLFAIAALRAVGCRVDDPAIASALVFVDRCQNFAPDERGKNTTLDDGGFFFIQSDPVRNKAGVAGSDDRGSVRFASYGSTTADGLAAMLLCGRSLDEPRPKAALKWLQTNFDPRRQPGKFAADREFARNAGYFYYCRSVSEVFRAVESGRDRKEGPAEWATAMAAELLKRQRDDGSWSNDVTDLREDDPLIATSFAMQAMANCRESILAGIPKSGR